MENKAHDELQKIVNELAEAYMVAAQKGGHPLMRVTGDVISLFLGTVVGTLVSALEAYHTQFSERLSALEQAAVRGMAEDSEEPSP